MTLDEFKTALIALCNSYYRDTIIQMYPVHTQINLISGIEPGAADFKTYISDMQSEFSELKTAINNLPSMVIHSNFRTDSDAAMMNYVYSCMPTLTTNTQKLAIAVALQNVRIV